MFRRTLPVGALFLFTGCAAADRESYSVAFSGKAHVYRDSGPVPEPAASPGLLEEYLELAAKLDRRAFRPFAYCALHDSDHVPESLLAVVAAPVEYPLVLTVNLTSAVFQGTFWEMARVVGLVGPPPGVPLPYENEEGQR
jgi:hypothetical protein